MLSEAGSFEDDSFRFQLHWGIPGPTSKTRKNVDPQKNPMFYLDHGHTPTFQQNSLNPPPKKTQNPVVDGLAKSVSSNLGTRWKPERCTKKPWPLPRRNFAISQRGKGIIIFKFALVGGMLVPWRIFVMIPSGKLTYIAIEYPHFQ